MDKNVNPKLDWLQERLDLSRDELKICLTLPATLAYSVDQTEPKLSYFEHELGMSPQEIRSRSSPCPPAWATASRSAPPRLAAIRATAGADPAAVIDRTRGGRGFLKRTGVSIDAAAGAGEGKVTLVGRVVKRVFVAALRLVSAAPRRLKHVG